MSFINIDILLLIADHVNDVQDYFRMMRVCRGWHATLSAKAYNRMTIQNNQVYAFASHIYKNPSLGAKIRNLDLSWEPTIKRSSKEAMKETLGQDAVRRACDNEYEIEGWNSELQAKDPDAWLAVMLQSLEGVTSLSLNYAFSNLFLLMIEKVVLRSPPFDTAPVLQKLQRVTIYDRHNDGMGLSTCELLPFFWLPAMRVFSAYGMTEMWDDDEREEEDRLRGLGKSGVREIHLGGPFTGCNGDRGMARCITPCANLEIFEYQHQKVKAVAQCPGEISPGFRPHEFYKALVTQKHSLRELRLNDRGENDTNDWDGRDSKRLNRPPERRVIIREGDDLHEGYTMNDILHMQFSGSDESEVESDVESDSDEADNTLPHGGDSTPPHEEDNVHHNGFGSLAEFCELRELRIPASTILQYDIDGKPTVSIIDVLPASLEYLHLSHCEENDFYMIMDELYSVLEHRKQKFPNLRRLCVRPSHLKELKIPACLSEIHQRLKICTLAQQLFAEFADVCHDAGIHFWISKGQSPAGDEPFIIDVVDS